MLFLQIRLPRAIFQSDLREPHTQFLSDNQYNCIRVVLVFMIATGATAATRCVVRCRSPREPPHPRDEYFECIFAKLRRGDAVLFVCQHETRVLVIVFEMGYSTNNAVRERTRAGSGESSSIFSVITASFHPFPFPFHSIHSPRAREY